MIARALLIAALAVLLAPITGARAAPRGGGSFVIATYADCESFNPYLTGDINSWRISSVLYNTLLRYDEKPEPGGGPEAGGEAASGSSTTVAVSGELARSWEMSPDGKRWTFELRPGVLFHDGHVLTAADVEFTLNLLVDPRFRTARRTRVRQLERDPQDPGRVRFDRESDYRFTVHFTRPAPWAVEEWTSLPILPRQPLDESTADMESFGSSNPVGTGPYRFRSAQPGKRILFEAFDQHFEGRPAFDRIVYRIVPDDHVRLRMLGEGAFDHAVVSPRQLMAGLPEGLAKRYHVYRFLEPAYAYIGWQCDPMRTSFFADPRVRRAMGQAIDVDALIGTTLGGHAVRVAGYFDPLGWAADPEARPSPADPARCVETLNRAGWYDTDGDGILDRGGQRFQFFLDAPGGSEAVKQQVELMAEQLRKVGVLAEPRFTPWEEFLSERVESRQFEAVYLAWHLPVEPDPHVHFHSSSIPTEKEPEGLNRNGYRSPRADGLIETARGSADRELRRRAYVELERLLAEDSPYTLLFRSYQFGLVSKRVRIEREGVSRVAESAFGVPILEVSRFGMLTDRFLQSSWVLPASPRIHAGLNH